MLRSRCCVESLGARVLVCACLHACVGVASPGLALLACMRHDDGLLPHRAPTTCTPASLRAKVCCLLLPGMAIVSEMLAARIGGLLAAGLEKTDLNLQHGDGEMGALAWRTSPATHLPRATVRGCPVGLWNWIGESSTTTLRRCDDGSASGERVCMQR